MSDAIISLDVLKSKEKHHYKGKGFIKNEIIYTKMMNLMIMIN